LLFLLKKVMVVDIPAIYSQLAELQTGKKKKIKKGSGNAGIKRTPRTFREYDEYWEYCSPQTTKDRPEISECHRPVFPVFTGS